MHTYINKVLLCELMMNIGCHIKQFVSCLGGVMYLNILKLKVTLTGCVGHVGSYNVLK